MVVAVRDKRVTGDPLCWRRGSIPYVLEDAMTFLKSTVFALTLGAFVACNGDDTDTDTNDEGDTDTDTDSDTDSDTDADTDTDVGDTDTDTDAGDTDADLYTLTFVGTGYSAHVGQNLYFAVGNPADTTEPATTQTAVGPAVGADLTVVFTDAMIEGNSYTLVWYADTDSNAMCGPEDHVWSMPVAAGPITMDVTINDAHDTLFSPNACDLLNALTF
jgi:hypothetical protein